MREPLKINDHFTIPESELRYQTSRSSGPGGQHVNRTNSRVSLFWCVTDSEILRAPERQRIMERLKGRINHKAELVVHVDTSRSQHQNVLLARERLSQLLREALHVQKKRKPNKVPRWAHRRRLEKKHRRSLKKQGRRASPGDGYDG